MHVWFVADVSPDSHGGVARSIQGFADAFMQKGCKVTIIKRPCRYIENYLAFTIYTAWYFVRRIGAVPDYIISRSSDAVICACICRLFRLKTRVILYNHGWEEYVYEIEKRLPRSILTYPSTWKALCLRFPLLRLMLRMCDVCISGTIYETRYLQKKYSSMKQKCVYLSNGIMVPHGWSWKKENHLPANFLCIGPMTWKKNIQHTVKIFHHIKKSIPDAQLYCVGIGKNQILPGCRGVHCISAVSHAAMEQWYRLCPYCIIASRYEGGHSFALLEALAYGLEVFVSPIHANREIVYDGKNGYLITATDASVDAAIICQRIAGGVNHDIRLHAQQTACRYSIDRQTTLLEKILCSMSVNRAFR